MAFSAALVAALMAFFFASAVRASAVNALQSDCLANPQQSTSRGSQRALQPCLLLPSTNSWYLARFLLFTSSIHFSQGTVSSTRVNCLVESSTMIMSGQRHVDVVLTGSFSCLLRSTSTCQFVAEVRRPDLALGCVLDFSPAL